MTGWKRIFFGEKAPDMDDPRYQKKREAGRRAGAKFAKFIHLDDFVARVQRFALEKPKVFFALLGAFVMVTLAINVSRMGTAFDEIKAHHSAVELQQQKLDSAIMQRRETHPLPVNHK